MSTPEVLLNELRTLLHHYTVAANRKADIICEMSGKTDGVWTDPCRLPLVVGKLYFVRVLKADGFCGYDSLKRWESHGWVWVYGHEYKLVDGDRLQVLVPTSPAPASSRRRSQGSKA